MNEATRKTLHSSKKQDWQTPPEELRKWERRFGFYTYLDPCTTPDNPLNAPKFYTEEDDGLEQSWNISEVSPRYVAKFRSEPRRLTPAVYTNPGYGRELGKWIRKAYWEHRQHGSMIVMLLPLRAPRWYHDFILPYLRTVENPLDHYVVLKGRLRFVGAESSAPFDSVLWIQKVIK